MTDSEKLDLILAAHVRALAVARRTAATRHMTDEEAAATMATPIDDTIPGVMSELKAIASAINRAP